MGPRPAARPPVRESKEKPGACASRRPRPSARTLALLLGRSRPGAQQRNAARRRRAVAIPAAPETQPAPAGSAAHHHALSLVGEPKYGPDFKHFDWVNPDAPKGGTVRGFVEGSFDSLNPLHGEGRAGGGSASSTIR